MSTDIPQMEPVLTARDREAVSEYLASGGWLTEFRHTREFEVLIAGYTGARFCATTPNCTLALFMCLAACGIGRGDEVIVPDFTMAASATSVLLAGADVVFVDIDPDTLCLDLEAAERAFTPRTKAVMFVSLNGRSPVGLVEFVARCRDRGIRVVEDAAQSLGSHHQGRHLGTVGDCGALSFSSQKLVTTGQGGAAITNDAELHDRMRRLRDFGRDEGGADRYRQVGWNFKFTDLQAVIGVEQMKRLPHLVKTKKGIWARYAERLGNVAGVRLPETDLDSVTPWFVDIFIAAPTRAALMSFLRSRGIASREVYPALHTTEALAAVGDFPVAQRVASEGIWLPSSLNLEHADIDRICDDICEFMAVSS